MSCGVGCRHGLDSTLLRLWCRPAAVAPIRPLARELPYAKSVALKSKKKKKDWNSFQTGCSVSGCDYWMGGKGREESFVSGPGEGRLGSAGKGGGGCGSQNTLHILEFRRGTVVNESD